MNLIQDQEDRRGLEVGGAAWRHGTKKVVKLLFTSANIEPVDRFRYACQNNAAGRRHYGLNDDIWNYAFNHYQMSLYLKPY